MSIVIAIKGVAKEDINNNLRQLQQQLTLLINGIVFVVTDLWKNWNFYFISCLKHLSRMRSEIFQFLLLLNDDSKLIKFKQITTQMCVQMMTGCCLQLAKVKILGMNRRVYQ